jgi:hypothetical protein
MQDSRRAADMQTNEFVGKAQRGPRRPQAEQALTATREAPETRSERRDADELLRLAARLPTRKPRRYGAGF